MKLFKRAPLGVALCSFAMAAFAMEVAYGASASIDPNRFMDDVKFLASKNLKGRGTGTPELEKAAAFIAAKFRSFGLEPIDGKSYYQAFSVTTNAKLGKDNRFAYTADGRHIKLVFRGDFMPFNFSARDKMSGAVVQLRRLQGHRRARQDRAHHAPRAAGVRREEHLRGQGLHAALAVLEQSLERQDARRARRGADERSRGAPGRGRRSGEVRRVRRTRRRRNSVCADPV